MKHINKLIIGSGISSFIYFKSEKKKPKVLTSCSNEIIKSKNFYEFESLGGNSNIWGGYVNFVRHKKFLSSNKYKNILKKKLFYIKKIFSNNSRYKNTYCITNKKNEIFRVKRSDFQNKLINKKIEKIKINNSNINLLSKNNKVIKTNKLILCIGNLNLIKLMYNSSLINSEDMISFDDGSCNYVINIFKSSNKDYFIPMPINQIIQKLVFKKSNLYKIIGETLILQKFSGSVNRYNFKCKDILKMKSNKIRYFLSNHVANLRVNNIPIRKFIRLKSNKIDVFCSGTIKKYFPGPVVQDLIFDILNNK